jgi:hypothetical protein
MTIIFVETVFNLNTDQRVLLLQGPDDAKDQTS